MEISHRDITQYINAKNFVNPKSAQSQTSVLTSFKRLADMFTNESTSEIFTRFCIGKSESSAKFAKSVIFDFAEYLMQKQVIAQTPMKSSEELAEELRIQEEKSAFLRREQQEAEAQAKAQYEELERVRVAEAEAKARKEQEEREAKRKARIEARSAGFVSEEIPAYIQTFDYMQNIPTKSNEYHTQGIEEKMLQTVISTGKHPILSGAAGTAKTSLVIKYAHENKIPLFKFSCSSDVRMDDLIGSKTIGSDGSSILWGAGMLTKAVLTANKYGSAIILLDEINTLGEKIQKNVNGLADDTKFIDLPMGKLKINDGVKFIIAGTMNLSYAGTNPLNPELKDRFVVIPMPKTSAEVKHKIYSKYSVSAGLENKLIELCDKVEELQRINKVSGDVVFSTRSQIAFLEILEELEYEQTPNAIREALNVTLVSKFDDENDKRNINSAIDEVFDQ